MVRYYCDICGEELKTANPVSHRVSERIGHFTSPENTGKPIYIEIMCGVGNMNNGHICMSCLRDAVFTALEVRAK